jgi:hypothetical protein
MRNIALAALITLWAATGAAAQGSTSYPASLDTSTTLPQAVDQKVAYLTAAATSGAVSITVNSTAGVPTSGVLQVDSELLSYATADATHFTVTRGFSGTAAAAHATNATVRFPLVAAHVNGSRGAVLALEAKLGTGASDASSASTGQVLTKQSGGGTAWASPPAAGIGSGYANVTDGTTTAAASGSDTFKLRSADNKLSVTVANNDATHGDNALLTVNQANLDRNALGGGALTVANGGTGATSAAAARTALGLGTAATKDVPASGNASASQVVQGDDTRLADARAPSGTAGGDLTGTYPSPTLTAIVTAGTNTKLTYDAKGRVTAGAQAQFSDLGGTAANSQLANSSVTVGSTSISLGGSSTSIAGLTGGVNFGGTTLSTYAEGTWTPTVSFNNASVGVTYSAQVGTYTRIGDRVLAEGRVTLSAKGSSTGAVRIGGLPFTTGSSSAFSGSVAFYVNGATYTGVLTGLTTASSTNFSLWVVNNGTTTQFTDAGVTNTFDIIISISYRTN